MENFNSLQQNRFKFKMDRIPNVEFRVQKVSLPGVTLGAVDFPSPFVKMPMPGNIVFDEFTIMFTVGEELEEYLEILNWMLKTGQDERLGTQNYPYRENMSDGSLIILDSASTANFNVTFTEMFPTRLSALEFDGQITGSSYVTASASFRFTRFEINKIT